MIRPIKVTLATRPRYATEGTVVEETDTGRQLVFNAGHWHVIPSVTTYEEWRVTGTWAGSNVDYTFSPARAKNIDPETAAKAFAAQVIEHGWNWTSGPHLHKHTVTVTDWTEVDT